MGKKHGHERAGMQNYTMDQLILEYHILRQVICEVLEEETPLSNVEREVITSAVEQCVNDAATQFSETLREVQERFTHTLAHDLRTPLTAAKLSSQHFLRNPDDLTKAATMLRRISVSMGRMDLLIVDLLDASRLRAGEALSIEVDDCDLDELLRQMTEDSNILDSKRVVYTSSGPVVGPWGPTSMRRVFDNLLTNALKFSDPDTEVRVTLEARSTEVEVRVHNSGSPIPEDEVSSLFEQHKRSRTVKEKKGWGLGLVVVKNITEGHGGLVIVESTLASGTTFKVTLPFTKK